MQLSEEEVKKFINGEKIDYKPSGERYELNKKKLVQDMAKTNSPYYDP